MLGFKSRNAAEIDAAPDQPEEILDQLDFGGVAADHFYPRSPREAIQPEHVPQPPAERRAKRHPIVAFGNGLISLLIFLFIASGGVFFILKQQFEAPGPLKQTRAVIVPTGATVTQIANRLEREGVITDGTLFLAGVYVTQTATDLKAGEYLFPEQVSMRSVMEQLVEGRAILHKITVPEGLTSAQIFARLTQDEVLTGEAGEVPPEGTLLPETYKVTRGTERSALIRRMQRAHERAVARIWERRDKDLPLKSPEELVILASIVEKETGRVDERSRVASVFVNRLKRSMRLQSDPTIIYGITGGEGGLGRPIRQSEIDKTTPYNTYQIAGLPPTPIANPGIEALEATANPSHTQDLYFVADGSGGHVFAATLDAHNRNVARWRDARKKARQDAQREQAESDQPVAEAEAVKPLPTMPLNLDLSPLPGTSDNSGQGSYSMQ